MHVKNDFFKLFNNAVHGRTMGNVRKRVDAQLISTEKRAVTADPFHFIVLKFLKTVR